VAFTTGAETVVSSVTCFCACAQARLSAVAPAAKNTKKRIVASCSVSKAYFEPNFGLRSNFRSSTSPGRRASHPSKAVYRPYHKEETQDCGISVGFRSIALHAPDEVNHTQNPSGIGQPMQPLPLNKTEAADHRVGGRDGEWDEGAQSGHPHENE